MQGKDRCDRMEALLRGHGFKQVEVEQTRMLGKTEYYMLYARLHAPSVSVVIPTLDEEGSIQVWCCTGVHSARAGRPPQGVAGY